MSARVASAELRLPVSATVGALTSLSVRVQNLLDAPQARAALARRGDQRTTPPCRARDVRALQLAPDAARQLTYNLMPIAAGQVALPPINVVARSANGGGALELVNNAGPRLLFVLPLPPVGMLVAS